MQTLSNVFYQNYNVSFGTSANPSGTVTVPTGYYLKAIFSFYGPSTGANTSVVTLTDNGTGRTIVSLGSFFTASANVFLTNTCNIILGAGTYAVATPQGFNTTNTVVCVHGGLFKI